MNIVPEGIIFVREGVSKQDRLGHISKNNFVPCLKKIRKLDRKRAVEVYMKKTSQFRNSTENKLFLSFLQPHKSVWIVSVIKQAYNETGIKLELILLEPLDTRGLCLKVLHCSLLFMRQIGAGKKLLRTSVIVK